MAVAGPDPAEGRNADAGQRVSAGFGTVVDVDGRVALPVPLLPPPDLSALPRLYERVLVRIAMPAAPGVSAWRGQVARDADFDLVLADLRAPGNQLRFADLPDGDYRLRVRAIDALGLEGRDSDHSVSPEGAPGAAAAGGAGTRRTSCSATASTSAGRPMPTPRSYRLQLATEPSFAAPLRELDDLRAPAAVLEGLPPGHYHWRLRSVRAPMVDQGPWGDPRPFRAAPGTAACRRAPAVGERSVRFDWQGAARPALRLPGRPRRRVSPRWCSSAGWHETAIETAAPGSGRFYVRLRAIDAGRFRRPLGHAAVLRRAELPA